MAVSWSLLQRKRVFHTWSTLVKYTIVILQYVCMHSLLLTRWSIEYRKKKLSQNSIFFFQRGFNTELTDSDLYYQAFISQFTNNMYGTKHHLSIPPIYTHVKENFVLYRDF